jgi:pimeloyl-ACP methyl ester carboxylesterase
MKIRVPLISSCLCAALSCGVDIIHQPEEIQDDTGSVEILEESEAGFEDSQEDLIEEEQADDLITDFLQPGPFSVTVSSRIASVTDCPSMDYSVYSPGVSDAPVVVLGHGFSRGSGVMTGWAEHLSSWGAEVLLPTLCHYNVWLGVDHEMNGRNMIELASLHGSVNTVYAGHSAGGLAAIIAASQDRNAVGVLGLDATDTEDVPGVDDHIGQNYAGSVTCPAFLIVGEPSTCNAENNGIDLFRMMSDYQAVKVISSDHCDFENPTDAVCEMSCENSTVIFGDSEIRSVIITLGTASVMSMTSLSEDGVTVWSDSSLQDWMESGIIVEIE